MAFRVTYATMAADGDEVHAAFDAGLAELQPLLGQRHGSIVSGHERLTGPEVVERSPVDTDILVGRFVEATAADVAEAVGIAKAFAPTWADTPWRDRVRLLEAGADLISERRNVISALLTVEVGKNRLESLGDVEETADLIRYYTHQLADHDGFEQPDGPAEPGRGHVGRDAPLRRVGGGGAVQLPGRALRRARGRGAGRRQHRRGQAAAAGRRHRRWPSCAACSTAGIPSEALHVVVGGDDVGHALVADPRIDGLTFTGSYEVGMELYRQAAGAYPQPVICEMGGKNPVIVSRQADLDVAAEGTARSAFGLTGQKCSAASRVYVERPVAEAFVERLVERARAIRRRPARPRHVPRPRRRRGRARSGSSGPSTRRGRRARCWPAATGSSEGALGRGYYVEPTVVRVPPTSWVATSELFVPLIAVDVVDSVDEAITLANDTPLGLTAGLFSRDDAEIDRFLSRIEAGVVYINRRAGATTGAWPGVQPFGGWKGSGSGGKAGGGPYYLQQYLREQSRTIVEEQG